MVRLMRLYLENVKYVFKSVDQYNSELYTLIFFFPELITEVAMKWDIVISVEYWSGWRDSRISNKEVTNNSYFFSHSFKLSANWTMFQCCLNSYEAWELDAGTGAPSAGAPEPQERSTEKTQWYSGGLWRSQAGRSDRDTQTKCTQVTGEHRKRAENKTRSNRNTHLNMT